MRVLVVGINYAPEATGIAPYTSAVAAHLAELGHDVRVLTTFPHYPEWRFTAGRPPRVRRERLNGVAVTRVRHLLPKSSTGVTRLLSEVSFGMRAAFARWHRPDLLILVSPALFATATVLLRTKLTALRVPTVVWVQDLYTRGLAELADGQTASRAVRLISFVESWVVRSADRVATIHDSFAASVRELGASAPAVDVVRNWTHIGSPLIEREAVRRRRGWRDDETIVLHAGNMGKKQQLENVVEAARLADEQERPVRFVLLGHGSERRTLEELATGVQRVELWDPLPDEEYEATLHAADILLVNESPALREMAVPSKLTSYFATALPVVAATQSGSVTAAEVRSAGGGLVVDPGRPDLLLRAALTLREDRALAATLGRRGRAYGERRLSEASALAHLEEILGLATPPSLHRSLVHASS